MYEVSMRSFGDIRVRGWYEVPKSKGPHPVILRVPGYGGNMKPIARFKDMIVFSLTRVGTETVRRISRENPVTTGSAGWMTRKATIIRGPIWIAFAQ